MALNYKILLFASFFMLLQVTSNNIISPPLFEDVCKQVECGKGKCKASNLSSSYVCECDLGWKKVLPDHENHLNFLPCVIPNCTLNYSCTKAPPPAQQKQMPNNESFFDPCHWADCGGGTCNKTSPFTHTCECGEGYYNLLNITAFPCFRDCALGMDCSSLGIGLGNKSASSSEATNLPASGSGRVSAKARADLNWMILAMMSLAMLIWM